DSSVSEMNTAQSAACCSRRARRRRLVGTEVEHRRTTGAVVRQDFASLEARVLERLVLNEVDVVERLPFTGTWSRQHTGCHTGCTSGQTCEGQRQRRGRLDAHRQISLSLQFVSLPSG